MKNLTWQNPEQLFVAQELINKVKSKCCGIKVHNIFVAGKEKMNFYVQPNPNLPNCATWMNFGTEQGNQYLNFHDINVYVPNGGKIYRYWKCRHLLQVSDNDERFSHFTEDERLF